MSGDLVLRAPSADESEAITELCMRSKAHWGYDEGFMAACRAELTLTRERFDRWSIRVCERDGRLLGVGAYDPAAQHTEIELLFVEPEAMGLGVGRILFEWLIHDAKAGGVRRMHIQSDPEARGFYERMGARLVGESPSGSIPGRNLPELVVDL